MELWDKKFNENQRLQKEVFLLEEIQKKFGKESIKLLDLFCSLNKSGKQKAIENFEDLSSIQKYIEKESD